MLRYFIHFIRGLGSSRGADFSAINQDGLTALDFIQHKILRAHEIRNDAMGSPQEVLVSLEQVIMHMNNPDAAQLCNRHFQHLGLHLRKQSLE